MDLAELAVPAQPALVGLTAMAVSAHTSEALLSLVATSRGKRPSKRAPSVTFHFLMNPKAQRTDTLLL